MVKLQVRITSNESTVSEIDSKSHSNYFDALTGVRALAAYMVYIRHFNPFTQEFWGKTIYDFTEELHIGVALFFVLSGFLIAYRYSDFDNISLKSYFVKRIARVFPMYFLLTTLTFGCLIWQSKNSLYQLTVLYGLNISFLRGFFDEFLFSGISQGWSLTVEETFYLLAPLMFLLIKRSKYFLLLLPPILYSIGIALVFIFAPMNLWGLFSNLEFMIDYTFFGRCFEFLVGVALAIALKKNWLRIRFRHFTYVGILGIVVSVYLITLFKGSYDFGVRHPAGKFIHHIVLPVFGIALFYYGLVREKTIVSKILSSKLFVLLGKSSYTFYLIHIGIFVSAFHQFTENYWIIFAGLILISLVLFTYVEDPLNRWIRKKFLSIESPTDLPTEK